MKVDLEDWAVVNKVESANSILCSKNTREKYHNLELFLQALLARKDVEPARVLAITGLLDMLDVNPARALAIAGLLGILKD